MSKIAATATVTYTSAASTGHLSAELDGRPDGFNLGNTNFAPHQSPVFLVWTSLPAIEVAAAQGTLTRHVERVVTRHEHEVAIYLPPGELAAEIRLDKPLHGDLQSAWELAPAGLALAPASPYADGTHAAVALALPANPAGAWVVGRIAWRSVAAAWRITAPEAWRSALPAQARVLLLVNEAP